MRIGALRKADIESTLSLFCQCFSSDNYYMQMFPDEKTRTKQMRESFRNSIKFCIASGLSLGVKDDGDRLAAFALVFDYKDTKENHEAEFNSIFGIQKGEQLPYYQQLHLEVQRLPGDTLYLLSIAVSPEYQKCGLASSIIDAIIREHMDCNLVSDVSNEASLPIYRKRDFRIKPIDEQYYLVLHKHNSPTDTVDFFGGINLLVPGKELLDEYGIPYQLKKEKQYLAGCGVHEEQGIQSFVPDGQAVSQGALVAVSYDSLLQYQRAINISQYTEIIQGDMLFYIQNHHYVCKPLLNDTLEEMLKKRKTEWSMIPDVYVSIPVQYLDAGKLKSAIGDETAGCFLKDMDFRTHYEAGVPSKMDRVDDLSSFKKRIKRYYLGKIRVQIFSEVTVENYEKMGDAIGPAAMVDMYISLDEQSNCAVLTWYSLSAPFLISHLFDTIIRNQLMVVENGSGINLFDYLKDRYNLIKRGTPKIFAILPCSKDRLSASQLASLLASETIYPDGENFGSIIDSEILSAVNSANGMGQYDRGFVCAYSNVVLQFSEDFAGSVRDRQCEESITLFYMELILFEEAAIHIADREIINLVTSSMVNDPIRFLTQVDSIYDSYSKTIDFWDIKVNYPTSQKSIEMLRTAFRIKEQLEEMKRNQEQLQTVFDTKCDIIDRKDSKRMDTSLAIISVLAIFSAWIDGYDYIATWDDVFPQGIIHILQRVLFLLILITAGYAITHLFGNKLNVFLKLRREKSKRARNQKRRRDP